MNAIISKLVFFPVLSSAIAILPEFTHARMIVGLLTALWYKAHRTAGETQTV